MQFIINDIVYIYLAEIIMFGTVLYYLIRILPMWICLLVFSILLVLFLIQKNGGKGNWCYWTIQYFFLSYLIFVLQIGGITRILFFLQNPVYFKPSTMTVNLIPFVDLFSDPSQYFANILLFVPFGFLFPFLAPKNRLHSTLLWGIGFSCSIEILQAFCLRTPDINDLLMNTLGVLLGYFLFAFFQKHTSFKYKAVQKEPSSKKPKMKSYFLFSYLFIFLFDFLTMIANPTSNP